MTEMNEGKVRELVAQQFGMAAVEDAMTMEGLNADELDRIEIAMAVEDAMTRGAGTRLAMSWST